MYNSSGVAIRPRPKILDLNLGQAFVIGASAILPDRGQLIGEQRPSDVGRKDKVYNMAVKQKAVYQPTLKHRCWLEQRKGRLTDSQKSIKDIESDLSDLRSAGASVRDYVRSLEDVGSPLRYILQQCRAEEAPVGARRAKAEEYRQITDSLLTIVSGSLGVKQEDNTRSSTLEWALARLLGYIVVGVDEYYASKKCPIYEGFVGQANMRRFHFSKCKYFMHHNIMATHNMCNIIRRHLPKQQRLLCQPRYQWKLPVHETGSERLSKRFSSRASRASRTSNCAGQYAEGDQGPKPQGRCSGRYTEEGQTQRRTTGSEVD
ncbi:hypothetical protein EDD11_006366 [Mortierella claussenii]|nr:hypothetical protein EDD11_006366 [Mortierella claussenii]